MKKSKLFTGRFLMFLAVSLIGTRKNNSFLGEQCFFDPKVLKECFGYHFHCFLVSSDKYVKNIFDEIFFVYIPF